MTSKSHEILRTQLLLKHPDFNPEECEEFFTRLIEYRFTGMLHLYTKTSTHTSKVRESTSLPAENEISYLLNAGHPELFIKNIIYHLSRNKKVLPPVLIPGILNWISNHPALWESIYHQHPELIIALAKEYGKWNFIVRAFDGDILLEIGSPGYYDTLQVRMQVLPIRTSTHITDIYPETSPVQQARLLEILHDDPSPETRQFIANQINHSRKPIRLAALKSCILQKEEGIYEPIKNRLLEHLKNLDIDVLTDQLTRSASWKDLESLTDETTRINTLVALTDPDDYLEMHTVTFLAEYRSSLLKAAILHRSQETLFHLAKNSPSLLIDPALIEALHSNTAIRILKIFISDTASTFDQTYIDLLKRIHPFLDEADSDRVWGKFVRQWEEMPFTLEELPLEVLALRIHPNRIKPVWQHSLLQETAAPLQKMWEILKNRFAFLKKCYRS